MKIKIKDINTFTKELSIKVEWSDLENAYNIEFKKAKSKYQIPGFRKGKVPTNIVKKNLQPSIEAQFIENSINIYYQKALVENEFNPINQAKIDGLDFKVGSELVFKAIFEITPEFSLPDFSKKIKIKTTKYIAHKEDIDRSIKDLQDKYSTVKLIDGGATSGNFINGDFHELDSNGEPLPDRKLENQYIKLGEAAFTGDVEKKILGAKSGDSLNVKIKNQDNVIRYKIDVKRVEEQILPQLNDEFAKTVDPSVKTLKELESKISDNIQSSLDIEHRRNIEESIVEFIIKKIKLVSPDSMIDNYLNYLIEDMKKNKQNVMSEEEIRKNYKDQADRAVKWHLIKTKILDENKLNVSDKDIKSKIDELKKQNPNQSKQIDDFYKDHMNSHKLSDEILNKKLFDYLIEFSSNKVTEKSSKELQKGNK
tara:strand:- start:413 stop:1684 length:1272 start_codon:yes stop_codon:yes gene_type:complete